MLGIAKNQSALNGSNIGAWTVIQSVDAQTAKRSYAASAYVQDGQKGTTKPNLIVLTGALVHRIALDRTRDGKFRATGVEFLTPKEGETIFRADATLEVILSAGTVQSPQILELSGIGDDSVLKKAGVQTQYHNPGVGRNLQDYLSTFT